MLELAKTDPQPATVGGIPAVRTIYPKMVNSKQLTPLFSLDASAQEIIWVVGPVITTLVATQIGTMQAIVLALAFFVGGGIWFVLSPELGQVRIPRSRRKLGVVLGRPPVMLATVVGFLLVGAAASVEATDVKKRKVSGSIGALSARGMASRTYSRKPQEPTANAGRKRKSVRATSTTRMPMS